MGNLKRRVCASICGQCGKEFQARVRKDRPSAYCSKECMWKAQVRREDRVCLTCGKTFHPHSMAAGMYCSHGCAGVAIRTNACRTCGKWVPSGTRYCSDGCREVASVSRAPKPWASQTFEEQFDGTLEWMESLSKQMAREEKTLIAVGCMQCGKGFLTASKRARFCSGRCSKRHQNRLKDRRLWKNGVPDGSITLEKLFVRDGGRCRNCGLLMTFECDPLGDSYPSIDHIIPIAKGGLHSWDNVQLLCRGCNLIKRDSIVPMRPALAVAWF